ncbi:MAG: hypothetical protein GWN46_15925, partial [Gammaproteobacteria bacterium]|nr:hypothetical protein [Gammaproteobacteria bacterium]
DLQRGYRNPPNAFVKNWKKHEAWQTAMDPSYGTVGLAVARGDDKWLVLVAVFLEDVPPVPDLVRLEAQVLEVINEIRGKRDLPPLVSSGALAAIARSHSEDMAERSY